jgi:A/G-specific adenine glycosylase
VRSRGRSSAPASDAAAGPRAVAAPEVPTVPEGVWGSLAAWYAPRREAYAWRRLRDPYATLVSEVMLQQTQAARVEPAFAAFLDRFPTVEALARASRADVIRSWSGLGYNRRAVALHEAATAVVRDHGGRVPADPDALRALPGVGPYTASAVASIAFGRPVAAVDTNVRRIVARVGFGAEPDEIADRTLRATAAFWVDRADPGAWNQALMDLGRERCRPAPRCGGCPLSAACRFAHAGHAGRPSSRRQPAFEGSRRQVRGRIVDVLRTRDAAHLRTLARESGSEPERLREALAGLVGDGLVEPLGRGRFRLTGAR